MREIRTSGLMSGDGKRGDADTAQATAPVLDSTMAFDPGRDSPDAQWLPQHPAQDWHRVCEISHTGCTETEPSRAYPSSGSMHSALRPRPNSTLAGVGSADAGSLAQLKMLKRHLASRYNMTPEDYRRRWGLAKDYPMVAPAYAAQRSALARQIGLGRKPAAPAALHVRGSHRALRLDAR